MAENEAKINIDGIDYLVSELSDDAKAQIQSLQYVEKEIVGLNAKLAVFGTAKMAYQNALKGMLPKREH